MTEPAGSLTPLPGQPALRKVDELVKSLPKHQLDEGIVRIKHLITIWPNEWKNQARIRHAQDTQAAADALSAATSSVTDAQMARDEIVARIAKADEALEEAVARLKGDPDVPRRRGSYVDHTGVYHNPIANTTHYGTLCLAVLADIAAFYQVIALAIGQEPWLLWLVVLAATTLSLFLMHVSGLTLREVAAGERGSRRWIAASSATGWVLLGGGAFTLRLVVDSGSAGAGPIIDFSSVLGPLSQNDTKTNVINAVLFLFLYVVTGLVAFLGAYMTKNALKEACRLRERERDEIRAELPASDNQLAAATKRKEEADHRLKTLEASLEMQGEQYEHEAEQLQVYADLRVLEVFS